MTPWRDGWRVKDPARPCYTCGTPPVYVEAGQPHYPSTCAHSPIMPDPATLDFGEYAPVRVILSDAEVQRARVHAIEVEDNAHSKGMHMKFDPTGESTIDVKARGFAAEIAAHRVTGLPLHWSLLSKGYRRADKEPDIGQRTEVRNAQRLDGRLVAYPGERKDYLYMLVVGEDRRYIVVGFLEGRDLIVKRRYEEPPKVRYPGYFASQSDLRPLAELPADA